MKEGDLQSFTSRIITDEYIKKVILTTILAPIFIFLFMEGKFFIEGDITIRDLSSFVYLWEAVLLPFLVLFGIWILFSLVWWIIGQKSRKFYLVITILSLIITIGLFGRAGGEFLEGFEYIILAAILWILWSGYSMVMLIIFLFSKVREKFIQD